MRVCLVAVVLLCGACSQRSGAPAQRWEALPLGTLAEFNGIWFVDAQRGWIAGGGYNIDGGLIGRTNDGGRTWRFTSGLAAGARASIEAVRFIDDQRGLIAMDGGALLATDDGGENWRTVRRGRSASDHVFALDFIDARTGWAAGLGGVLRTDDGGETWHRASAAKVTEREWGHAIRFVDASNGWLAGQHGLLLATIDGGETWSRVSTPLAPQEKPYLFDVSFVDERNGWVVGEEGTILHTDDGGETWSRQQTGVAGSRSEPRLARIQRGSKVDMVDLGDRTPGLFLTSVRFLDRDRGWTVGHFGALGRSLILATKDGGATWSIEADVDGEDLRALFVLDADHVWAVGHRVREGSQVLYRRRPDAGSAPN